MVIRTQESAVPIRYSVSKSVVYVDEAGNPVAREIVKTGVPVTVRYVREGDRMIVNRVIVHQATAAAPEAVTTEKTTTTTTTTEGRHEKDKDRHHDKIKQSLCGGAAPAWGRHLFFSPYELTEA
ncbi:MAG: hypothetical protein WDN28_31075 [Chthoniobacter sp.]